MRTFFGAVTEIHDLGVVAENCPHCEALRRCLFRTVTQGHYVCFVKIADPLRESSCLCTDCLKPFPGKPRWSYSEIVPIRDARGIELDDLVTKTNPILADRIHFKEQILELGGDSRFVVAYENVEGMRPGLLRSGLLASLLDWPRLTETQRSQLVENIGAQARAWRFARQMAIGFPTSSGSLAFFLSLPLYASILIVMLITRSWIWGGLAFAASAVATTVIETQLFKQTVARWTRKVLIPEAQEVNVPLERFVAVVDDIPGSRLGLTEELWPMKHELPNIRKALIAAGKLKSTSKKETH